jgi:uncharacterized protein (TIGR03437 family)
MRATALLILSITCRAQVVTEPGWSIQHLPPGTPTDLRAVAAPDANTVVVVGASGTILRTTDDGTTWSRLASHTAATLHAVTFGDAKTGIAVGGAGTILRTEDGGASWTFQPNGAGADICGVAFKDAKTGIAVGSGGSCDSLGPFDSGFILRTTDGGATWTSQFSNTPRLWAVTFADADTVMAAGDQGTVLRSVNAGMSWTALHNGDKLIGGVRAVFFHNPDNGIAVGGGGIYLTHDGGVSWEARLGWLEDPLTDVHFIDPQTGTAVSSRGAILRTTDGGLTWKVQPSRGGIILRGVFFRDAINGWAVGTGGLLRTTTGGEPGPVAVSAASLTAPVAPESLATLVGSGLATSTAEADPQSPTTTLGGISLRVHDSAGQTRLAGLFYVSPRQINFQVPAETAPGDVRVEIVNASFSLPEVRVAVRSVAPGLFVLADGKAAAYGVRVDPDGKQTILPPGAIILDERPVYLIAYATGVRNRSALENVQAMIGGINVPVTYAGPAGDALPGLDQVNILLSTALKGTDGRLILTVDGPSANPVRVDVR